MIPKGAGDYEIDLGPMPEINLDGLMPDIDLFGLLPDISLELPETIDFGDLKPIDFGPICLDGILGAKEAEALVGLAKVGEKDITRHL
jgi:hypothetical protein